MRGLFFILCALAVIGSGSWAYRENYATQAELDQIGVLNRQIEATRERLDMLRIEWAYLNRPDRLLSLADLNFERLGLLAMRAGNFATIDQVAYPMLPKVDLSAPIEIISTGEGE